MAEKDKPVRKVKVGPFRVFGTKGESTPDDRRNLAVRVKRHLRGVSAPLEVPDPDEDVRVVSPRPAGEASPRRSFLAPSSDDDDDI